MHIEATFLGTGTSQGVPIIGCDCPVCRSLDFRDKRLRTSIHFSINGKSIVIDSGPDFRQQMLQNYIHDLDALIFTHEHQDHVAGLDDVRPINYLRDKDIPIYASAQVRARLEKAFHYVFATEKYPGAPRIQLHQIDNSPFEAAGVLFTPIEVMHYKLPVLGFRIGDFTYITDANFIAESEQEKIKGSKVLVLNALRQREHLSHFTLEEALELIEKLQPERAFLTHISHQMGKHAEISEQLPAHVQLAYDGLKVMSS
mgnify:CR=1 FL=1